MRKLSILVALLVVVAAVAILARGYLQHEAVSSAPAPLAQGEEAAPALEAPLHGPVSLPASVDTPTVSPAEQEAPVVDTPRTPAVQPPAAGEFTPPPGHGAPGGEESAQATSDAREVLVRAAESYGKVRSLRADFVQRVENPILGRTTVSRGMLAQRRPDRFLMDFSDPEGDVIVSDGEHLWVYYPSVDPKQVIRLPAGSGAGGVDLQAQFLGDPLQRFHPELRGEEPVQGRAADILVLTPRVPTGYRRLVLWVDRQDALARRFEIVEENDTVRRFDLSDLRIGTDLSDNIFRFTPPAGAHVVDRG